MAFPIFIGVKFWRKILDAKDSTSSKRLVTLIVALHFILASFVILFLVCYVVMYLPKGKVEKNLLDSLGKVLEYDFYIILSGLGFITSEGIVQMIVSKNTPPQQNYGSYGSYNSYEPINSMPPIPDPTTQEESNIP